MVKDKEQKYVIFNLKTFRGFLHGDDKFVHQEITNTICLVSKRACIPIEQKMAVLVWNNVKHSRHVYRKMVQKIQEFLVIPSLGVGGSTINEQGPLIMLDNTYIVKRLGKKI